MNAEINYKGLYKNKWFILVLILVVLWFIWFQLRPSFIRQNCNKNSLEMGIVYFNLEFLQNETALRKSQLQQEYVEKAYDRCLHDKGL